MQREFSFTPLLEPEIIEHQGKHVTNASKLSNVSLITGNEFLLQSLTLFYHHQIVKNDKFLT